MNDRRFTKEKDLSGNLDCEKPEEAARAEKIVGGTGNGNDGNDNNADNDRDESKQSFGISGSHSVLKEPTTDEHALKQFMFVCMDTTDGTDSTAFKEASAAVLNGSVGKSGINIARESNINDIDVAGESDIDDIDVVGESNIDNVDVAGESNVNDVDVAGESDIDDVDVAGKSNIDNVNVAGESNIDNVNVAGKSNVNDVDVARESNINNFAMKNLTTADGENSNTGISAGTATDNSVAVNIVATADNSAAANNVATADNVAMTATVNNTTEAATTTATAAVSAETLISSEPGTNKNTPIVVERVGNKNTTEMQTADIKTGKNSKPRLDLLNPNYEYVLSSGIGSYKYDIYVKKCAPEVRDALAFLNMTSEWEARDTNYYPKDDDVYLLKKTSKKLRRYIRKQTDLLKVFFTRINGYYILTTCLLKQLICKEDITFDMILNKIDDYSDLEIFVCLLLYAYPYKKMSGDFIMYAVSSEERFYSFIEGTAYSEDMKTKISDIYEFYNLKNPKHATLKKSIINFLQNYFCEYKKAYASVQNIAYKKHCKTVSDILSNGKLPGIMDNALFHKIILRSKCKKYVILENMLFAVNCAEYYGTEDQFVICVGYGYDGSLCKSDDYERLGNKLKYFSCPGALQILKLLSENSYTANEISEKTHIHINAVYKQLKKFTEQKILVKERGFKYSLNEDHWRSIIKLLETYGGVKT